MCAAILAQGMRRLLISCPTHPLLDTMDVPSSVFDVWCVKILSSVVGVGTPTSAAPLSELVMTSLAWPEGWVSPPRNEKDFVIGNRGFGLSAKLLSSLLTEPDRAD